MQEHWPENCPSAPIWIERCECNVALLNQHNIKFSTSAGGGCLILEGISAVDYLGLISRDDRLIKTRVPLTIRFKLDEGAIMPKKAHFSDVGYDLAAVGFAKGSKLGMMMLSTGVYAAPPPGYYLEVVPRSSLSKTGYALANSIGVIDPSYRGEILIAIRKVHEDAALIEFPFNRFQLILRRQMLALTEVVDSLDETARADGGFGSTDSNTFQ